MARVLQTRAQATNSEHSMNEPLKHYGTEPKALLKWRSKQKSGSIMKPSTFKKIEHKAAASGATDAKKVAGAAYWNTVRAKYKKSK